jgi:hypothetical protein
MLAWRTSSHRNILSRRVKISRAASIDAISAGGQKACRSVIPD